MGTGWWVTEVNDTNIHTHPDHDLIHHDLEGDCICGPEVEAVEGEDGSFTFLTHHSALDGRDIRERGQTIPEEVTPE